MSKRSETRAGPKLRAGLREAPEMAPSAQIVAAKTRPMPEVPQEMPEESGSVDPSTAIVKEDGADYLGEDGREDRRREGQVGEGAPEVCG